MPAAFDRRAHCIKIGLNTRFIPNKIIGICERCQQRITYIKSSPRKYCGYKCSNLSLAEKRVYPTGKMNHLWKGGITSMSRARVNNAKWRKKAELVRKRDGYECQGCHYKGKLYVHHIVPWRITHDDNEMNLITLCARCHKKQEHTLNKVSDWVTELKLLRSEGYYA